jgi:hypothetical protein
MVLDEDHKGNEGKQALTFRVLVCQVKASRQEPLSHLGGYYEGLSINVVLSVG